LGFSLTLGNVPMVTFWNLVSFLMSFSLVARESNPDPGIQISCFIVLEGLYAASAVCCAALASHAMWAQARKVIEAKAWSGERSATQELLHLVCDAVVELNEDLRIVEDVPKFAAMVTPGPSGTVVRGAELQQYMAKEEDRQRFQQLMTTYADSDGSSLPKALHASLRDSLGNLVNVEMFYVHFQDIDLRRHYFVGIREFYDMPIPEMKNFPPPNHHHGLSTPSVARQILHESRRHAGIGSTPPSLPSSSAASLQDGELLAPELRKTERGAMLIAIVETMKSFNVPVPPSSCCRFHGAVSDLLSTAQQLTPLSCSARFGPRGVEQCNECGVLVKEAKGEGAPCPTCGEGVMHAISLAAEDGVVPV